MKGVLLVVAVLALTACQATFPLGEGGKYGEVFVGYRPPASFGDVILNQPTLLDK